MEKIESYKDVNSTRAFVQTYDDDEVKIEFEGQLVSVRIRLYHLSHRGIHNVS